MSLKTYTIIPKPIKQQLEVLMKEVVGFIKDGDTAVQIIPMLKEYLEINVKNDEQLVKLSTIVQRIRKQGEKEYQIVEMSSDYQNLKKNN